MHVEYQYNIRNGQIYGALFGLN